MPFNSPLSLVVVVVVGGYRVTRTSSKTKGGIEQVIRRYHLVQRGQAIDRLPTRFARHTKTASEAGDIVPHSPSYEEIIYTQL